ncbi:MAG: BadF/BadG/BcrA/BcrD ATPase family protein [Dermatophilaceae bacterium]
MRGVIGLDGGSHVVARPCSSTRAATILAQGVPALEGQPDPGHQGAARRSSATTSRSRAPRSRCIGFGATGYAADVLQECVRADVNIVETVAHMMSAVHFFGDVDVICDIGGQDIKVLFMKNGDIANFRLSNSCSAGNGMLLQAMADQFGVPVTEYADTAFEAELAPKFSYGCAVFLDTDRVNFQKEGFSKEELLAGLAQVLPKNVWQYVVQIPRLASLGHTLRAAGRHAVQPRGRQGAGRLHQGARAGRRGLRAPAHRRGRRARRGVRDAARRQAARARRTFIGIDAAIDLEYTTKNDEETVCHFCPNECKRTFIDTKRPDGSTVALHLGLLVREGHRRERGGDARARRRPQEDRQAVPEPRRLRGEARVPHFYKPAPLPADGRARSRTSRSRRASSASSACEIDAALPAQRQRERRRSCAHVRIGIPRVLNIYSTAPYFRTYFEALGHAEAERRLLATRPPRRCGSRAASTARSTRASRRKVAQAHIHNLLFHHHDRREAAQLHLLPDPHARAELRSRT